MTSARYDAAARWRRRGFLADDWGTEFRLDRRAAMP
jgi:hypothetical protein